MDIDLESDDDDLDLVELDRLARSRQTPVHGQDLGELKAKLEATVGENSILRMNLTQMARVRDIEKAELVQAESDANRRQREEIEALKQEIARLKTEKQFLNEDLQERSFQIDRAKTRKQGQNEATQPGASWLDQDNSPVHTPKKKRRMNENFSDGFDMLSPRKARLSLEPGQVDSSSQPVSAAVNAAITGSSTNQSANIDIESVDLDTLLLQFSGRIHSCRESLNGCTFLSMLDQDRQVRFLLLARSTDSFTLVTSRFARECVEELTVATQSGAWAHCLPFLGLLAATIESNPLVIQADEHRELLHKILGLLRDLAVSSFKSIPPDSRRRGPATDPAIWMSRKRAQTTMACLYSLDVLEVMVGHCAADEALSSICWQVLDHDLFRLLLGSRAPSNIRTLALAVLQYRTADFPASLSNDDLHPLVTSVLVTNLTQMPSAPDILLVASLYDVASGLRTHALGPVVECSQAIAATFSDPQMRGSRMIDLHRSHWEMYEYELAGLESYFVKMSRLLALRFFMRTIISQGITRLLRAATRSIFMAAVVQCLSGHVQEMHQQLPRTEAMETIRVIEALVTLLHAIWILYSESDTIPAIMPRTSSNELLVTLARLAFEHPKSSPGYSGGIPGLDESTIEKARYILEQCTTLEEADEIYNSMA